MDFKNAAFRKSSANSGAHGGRICTSCLCQQHGFSNDRHSPADYQLIAQFGNLPCTIRADKRRTTHDLEYRFCTFEIVL